MYKRQGRFRWLPRAKVTTGQFGGALSSQITTAYTSEALRNQRESNPQEGQTCLISDSDGYTLQVYTRGSWRSLAFSS